MAEQHVLNGLARTWWFPKIAGYRVKPGHSGTYLRFDLDDQPDVPPDLATDLRWLQAQPAQTRWAITQDDDLDSIFTQDAPGRFRQPLVVKLDDASV